MFFKIKKYMFLFILLILDHVWFIYFFINLSSFHIFTLLIFCIFYLIINFFSLNFLKKFLSFKVSCVNKIFLDLIKDNIKISGGGGFFLFILDLIIDSTIILVFGINFLFFPLFFLLFLLNKIFLSLNI